MYGLDQNTNLDFLQQQTLVQVCFGENDLTLNFDGSASIHIEVGITIGNSKSGQTTFANCVDAISKLAPLVGRQLHLAQVGKNGSLRLGFDGDLSIEIFDENETYESYQIIHPGGAIVV